ncbi:MAG TPA: primosomal protein [Pseudonocardia sp.]|nr:primosomal protein [Pseudonocardia sp.]
MAAPNSDIVPIQLSLTSGDLITLWAPRWREDGEEWEAFLGDDDSLFAFPDTAALAAFVRTAEGHDLCDHPAWPIVRQLSVAELVPEEAHCYDLVGAPAIVADDPDTWTVSELAEIVGMTRSLADTCGLRAVEDVLDSAAGFSVLDQGSYAFSGRDGSKRWAELTRTVAARWDEVLDALDALVVTPQVDEAALAAARRELAAESGADPDAEPTPGAPARPGAVETAEDGPAGEDSGAFWEHIGIDPILISTPQGEYYTLRCYLDDKPVFLGSGGRIDALPSARALARHLTVAGAEGHDLVRASTWPELMEAAAAGEVAVEVDPENTYQLTGIGDDLAEGPVAVDPHQLDLAVELLLDVGEWAGDDGPKLALGSSQSLGWLTSFVLRPDPTRLAPSPPFDAEAGRWNALVDELTARLRRP